MSKKKNKNIWITWHYAARSRNLTKELDLDIYELFLNKNIIVRHLFSPIWTLWVLLKVKPNVVYIQLSFMLLNVVSLYKIFRFNKVILIADCHTKALRRKAKGPLNYIFWPIKKATFKLVDLSIVSNDGMKKDIQELHNNFIILPDKIPENIVQKLPSKEYKYCVYISAFAIDEPFDEIFKVAELLSDELILFWTGKRPNSKPLPENVPDNLKFTGFISFEEYYDLIGNADCILALTTEQDCLQSGAYEALNVGIPMVISDSFALREYFVDSALYTDHKPESIANNILAAIEQSEELKKKIVKIKEQRDNEFNQKIKNIYEFIS